MEWFETKLLRNLLQKKEWIDKLLRNMLSIHWNDLQRSSYAICYKKRNELIRLSFYVICYGVLTNYVDNILPIIDHLPTPCWHLWRNSFKVQILWEGHKNLKKYHTFLEITKVVTSKLSLRFFSKFCGLLRISELY